MNIEDRLRRAIAARTRTVEPSDDGLRRIHEKLLHGEEGDMDITPTNRWYVVAAVAAVVLALAGGGLALAANDGGSDDRTSTADDPDRPDDDRTTTTESTTESTTTSTTEAPGTTTTTTAGGVGPEAPETPEAPDDPPPADVISQAVWPRPSSDVRFDDPAAAASSWARFYAGFTNPSVGDFRQGDSRSGEVPVFPRPGGQGAATTVLVRQLSDDNWYVIGSTTGDVTVTRPTSGAQLTCPQPLEGTALAYEGTVQVRIDAYQPDGDRVTVAETFVTGSGSPPAGPFEGQADCTIPSGVEPYGIVHFSTPDEGEVSGILASVTFPIRLR